MLSEEQRDECCTVVVENDNPAWSLLIRYGEHIRDRTTSLGVDEVRLRTVSKKGRIELGLATGVHRLKWDDFDFTVEVWSHDGPGGMREGARIHVPPGGGMRALESFLVHARGLAREKSAEDSESVVLKVLKGTVWRATSTYPKRRPDSLVLMDDAVEKMLADMHSFRKSEEVYGRWGFAFKRNYLVVGPPGSGKSSLVMVAASEMDLDICYLTVTSDMTEKELCAAVSGLTDRSMLVIEDVEVLCSTATSGHSGACAALAVLTNVLDGTLHRHGLVTVLTSAQPQMLENALMRKGRIDFTTRLKEVSESQASLMTQRMLECSEEQARGVAARMWGVASGLRLTSTTVAHFLFRHRDLEPEEITGDVCAEMAAGTHTEHVMDARSAGRDSMFS